VSLRIRDTGTNRTAIEARFRDGDGVTKPIERMILRTASGTAEFYRRGIRLSASPSPLVTYSDTRRPVASSQVMVSASGGTPPYAHAWAADYPLAPINPTSGTTGFTIPRNFEGEVTVSDLVTDANGLSAGITVQVVVYSTSGGDQPIA